MKNLIDEYKRVCDANGTSGNSRHTFVYFDEINDILGTRETTRPSHLIEVGSLQDDPAVPNPDEENNPKERNSPTLSSSNNSSSSSEPKTKGKKAKHTKIQDDSDKLAVLTKYLEESEKREQAFF